MSPAMQIAALGLALFLAYAGAPLLIDGLDAADDLRDAPTTTAISLDGAKGSRHVVISVDGEAYHCAPIGKASVGAEVRYLADDPSRCRLSASIGTRALDRVLMGGFLCIMALATAAIGSRRALRAGGGKTDDDNDAPQGSS